MSSLKNLFWVSSPSSSSASLTDSPVKQESEDGNPVKNDGKLGSNRRLNRQRKLRYVSDEEIGLRVNDERSRSWPVSPTSGSRSPADLPHWSTWAVPQPLPLPLPKEALSRWEEDGRGRNGERNSSSSATGSSSDHQTYRRRGFTDYVARKSSLSPTYRRRAFTDHVARKSSLSPTYRRRVYSPDSNIESVHTSFRHIIPPRSAPTSGVSSPTLSPKRFRSVDLFHFSVVPPKKFQGFSDLDISDFDKLAGSSSRAPPTKITHSTEHSPLHSQTSRSPCGNATRTTCVALQSRHKSLPENSTKWPEGNTNNNINSANVHPLPLPPGVSKPSLSITIHQHSMEKPERPLMKNQWQKGELIGRGTYGSVYLATNRETGASCAVKEVDLVPDDPISAECIKQLEQEIKVLRHLEHPNIVQYYGCEIVGDRFCIYLEYIHPGSINKYVRKNGGAVTESVVRNFTRHILSGLAYLHSTKTIHRDIKGANLLVNASGVVKLADFGLAKHLTGLGTNLSLKGSPHWMAPEVMQAVMQKGCNCELAFAVDIWSLGCTVIEMLNGNPPWSEFNGVQAMFSVLHKSPAIPETLSSEGKNFLELCFQRNPEDRPSAAKLLGHPFVRNSREQNVSDCLQEFSGMKLTASGYTPKSQRLDYSLIRHS